MLRSLFWMMGRRFYVSVATVLNLSQAKFSVLIAELFLDLMCGAPL